jgi:hypothetical protein
VWPLPGGRDQPAGHERDLGRKPHERPTPNPGLVTQPQARWPRVRAAGHTRVPMSMRLTVQSCPPRVNLVASRPYSPECVEEVFSEIRAVGSMYFPV